MTNVFLKIYEFLNFVFFASFKARVVQNIIYSGLYILWVFKLQYLVIYSAKQVIIVCANMCLAYAFPGVILSKFFDKSNSYLILCSKKFISGVSDAWLKSSIFWYS